MSAREAKLAKDVAKLRRVLKSLQGCATLKGCTRCNVPQSCTCQEHARAIIDAVLAATAKKPRG